MQSLIAFGGVNLNAVDRFDNLPLTLVCPLPFLCAGVVGVGVAKGGCNKASLCGHYEVVELLLESGAVCERDTFQGERILYNALNNRIKSLLLRYDVCITPVRSACSHPPIANVEGRR